MVKIGNREIKGIEFLVIIIASIVLLFYVHSLFFVSAGYGDVKVIPVDSAGRAIGIGGMPITSMYNNQLKFTNEDGYVIFTHLPSPKDTTLKFKFKVNHQGGWGYSSEYCYLHVERDKTNILRCRLSGSAPTDGEMKCEGIGASRYSASFQRWQLVETCSDIEACECVDKFHCSCESSGCTPGWYCTGSNVRAYRSSNCVVTTSQCPSSAPRCYEGRCVECRGDGDCNDYHAYTMDRCVDNKCEYTGIKPTTTTIYRPPVTTTTIYRPPPGVTTTTTTTTTPLAPLPSEIPPDIIPDYAPAPPVPYVEEVEEVEEEAPPKKVDYMPYLLVVGAIAIIIVTLSMLLRPRYPLKIPEFIRGER